MSYDADVDIGRGMIRRVEVMKVEDKGEFQTVTVLGLADEVIELSMRGQGHGLTSVPPVGAVGYCLLAGGRADQAFFLGLEHPDERPKDRKSGETVLYASKKQTVELDDNGDVLIKSPSGVVHINPPG